MTSGRCVARKCLPRCSFATHSAQVACSFVTMCQVSCMPSWRLVMTYLQRWHCLQRCCFASCSKEPSSVCAACTSIEPTALSLQHSESPASAPQQCQPYEPFQLIMRLRSSWQVSSMESADKACVTIQSRNSRLTA